MTTLKSLAVLVFTSVFSFISCGQSGTSTGADKTTTTTTPAAKQTTTVAKSTTTVKSSTTKAATTAKTKAGSKVPQSISKTTTTKTTKTQTLTKPATTKTTANQSQTTTEKTGTGTQAGNTQSNTTTTQTTTGGKIHTGTGTPTETPGTTTQTQTTTGGKIQTGTSDNTNTTNTTTQPQTTGGKIQTGTGNNTNTNTNTQTGTNIINTITEGDASSAIKEALMKGIQVGVDKVSVTDGYFKNAKIKIPLPAQVKAVESTLRSVGMGSVVDNMLLSMNRAAESAAKQAGPIFINGIKQMTVTDAVNIVSNQQPDAATQFLKRTTSESLVTSFKPSIKTALDKTLATKYWAQITGYYNKLPFVTPISTDLPDFVTRKAIDGLFYMVAQEEAKIRKDPIGTGSDIIDKVFGSVIKR